MSSIRHRQPDDCVEDLAHSGFNASRSHASLHAFFSSLTTGIAWIAMVALGTCAALTMDTVVAVEPVEVSWLLYNDPVIQTPVPEKPLTSGRSLVPKWDVDEFKALDRAGKNQVISEMLRRVQDQELYGQTLNNRGEILPSEFIEPMLAESESREPESTGRRRTVSVLLHTPSEQHAAKIWELGKSDPMLRPLIEAKLTLWKSNVALDDWRSIVTDTESSPQRVLTAARGLAVVGDESDADALRTWLKPNQAPDLQIAVAHAIASLAPSGNLDLANSLYQPGLKDPSGARVAAALLQNDASTEAAKVLAQIAQEHVDGAHELAFLSLLKHQPKAAAQLSFQLVEDGNHVVRRKCIELIATSKSSKNLVALFGALNDAHPDNRRLARTFLLRAADDSKLRTLLSNAFAKKLKDPDWRTVEQSILGVVALRNRTTIPTLAKLIKHPVPSVNVTAAWSLKELADQPVVLDQISKFVADRLELNQLEDPATRKFYTEDEWQLHSQLVEMLGKNRHSASEELLKKFVGRSGSLGALLRSCAIWSLSKIRQGNAPDDMKASMRSIVLSMNSMNPENPLVAFAAILASGRFQDQEMLPLIEEFEGSVAGRINLGEISKWATEKINAQ